MPIVTRVRIMAVIHCGWWQNTRLSMKGIPTREKLLICQQWLENDEGCQYNPQVVYEGESVYALEAGILSGKKAEAFERAYKHEHFRRDVCGWTERRDQVLNYLTALSRGGQIAPLDVSVWLPAFKPRGTINFDLIVIRK